MHITFFHESDGNYLHTYVGIIEEGKSISEWSERNRKAGEIWRDMTTENKTKYYQMATQTSLTNAMKQNELLTIYVTV